MTQEKKSKFALVMKVLERVLLALVSAYAAYMSTNVSHKTDTNDANAAARLGALMETINKVVIPGMRNNDAKLDRDFRELNQDVSAYAERLARIEGIIEALPIRYRGSNKAVTSIKPTSDVSKTNKPSSLVVIPSIDSQQIMEQVAIEVGDE